MDMLLATTVEPAFFSFDLKRLAGQIPGYPLRSMSTTTFIQNGREVPFAKQENEQAHRGNAGAEYVPTNATELGAFAGTGLLIYGLQSLTVRHREIPAWVLEVDPEFSKHGGNAQWKEFLSIQRDSTPNLFDLPTGYQKVKPEGS